MAFTGDSICIKGDLSFVRIDNLKEGDYLFNPETKEKTKIIKIETFYSEEGLKIQTNNFFEINISKDTFLKVSNLNIDNKEFYLNKSNYLMPTNFNRLCFLAMPKINSNEKQSINELFLYSKLLLKGSYDNINNKIIFNNAKDSLKNYQKHTLNKNMNSTNNTIKKIYINDIKNIDWINNLEYNSINKNLIKEIFNIRKQEIENFLKEFIIENSNYYLDDKNFRIYMNSKILATQLFYLILSNTNKTPIIEKIKKELWNIKNVKSSNKKNKYSVSCHDKIEPLILIDDYYYQQITFFDNNKRNLKYIKIITENNDPFVVYNMIVKEN